jgi:hypothetical protein
MPTPSGVSVYFPPLNGGEETGFNDAGVEQFKHDRIESLMRECTQNSSDALDESLGLGNKVRVEFELIHVPVNALPGSAELKDHLERCLAYVTADAVDSKEKKAQQFFRNAVELLDAETIPCLLVRDFNTTGLTGGDDDRGGRWHSLVKAKGSSNKSDEAAGGSFGIGKSAPFACSALRTVFYGTRNNDGVAVQGKSVLITHHDESDEQTQGVGFIGLRKGNKVLAVRDEAGIPEFLNRKENGTDVMVVGFTEKDWADKIKAAALTHFWPALELKRIEFSIKEKGKKAVHIDHANLDEGLTWLRKSGLAENAKEIPDFLEAFREKPTKLQIVNAGECRFHLRMSNGENDYPNTVCCFRTNAMVIEYMKLNISGNFVGVFMCDSKTGSKVFREMEPPRHDMWTPTQPQDEQVQKRCKETYDDMRDQCRKVIRERIEKDIKESVDPDELELAIPNDGDPSATAIPSLEPNSLAPGQKISIKPPIKPRKKKPLPPKPPTPPPVTPVTPVTPIQPVGPIGKGKEGKKRSFTDLRCLLSAREATECTYAVQMPKLEKEGVFRVMAYAEGYDGTMVEVAILDPKDSKITVKPGMNWSQIKVVGKPMSLTIKIEE